jgi:uncharacterized protein (DUF697 family)
MSSLATGESPRCIGSSSAGANWRYRELLNGAINGAFDDASETEKSRAVQETIRMSSARAALLTLQPLAFVDGPVLTRLQARMVRGIGRIRGRCDRETLHEIFRPLRRRLIGPHLTIAATKLVPLIPVLPDLVAVSVAYALTYTIGELSDEYFRACPPFRPSEMRARFDLLYRRRFERTYREKREELRAMLRSKP